MHPQLLRDGHASNWAMLLIRHGDLCFRNREPGRFDVARLDRNQVLKTGLSLGRRYVFGMDIAGKIFDLLAKRAVTASICPSDVARALADDEAQWRALMPAVREAAAALAREDRIVITQRNRQVHPADVDHGAIRLRRGPAFQ